MSPLSTPIDLRSVNGCLCSRVEQTKSSSRASDELPAACPVATDYTRAVDGRQDCSIKKIDLVTCLNDEPSANWPELLHMGNLVWTSKHLPQVRLPHRYHPCHWSHRLDRPSRRQLPVTESLHGALPQRSMARSQRYPRQFTGLAFVPRFDEQPLVAATCASGCMIDECLTDPYAWIDDALSDAPGRSPQGRPFQDAR